jgi:hypothetical protein
VEHRNHNHAGHSASDSAEVRRDLPALNRSALNKTALSATVHCLTGCALGEVLGTLLRAGLALKTATALAFASDTASIALMEIVDNLIMLFIPGAMDAGLSTLLFWGSLVASLVIAGIIAFPFNRWLIRRGVGHAVLHRYNH